ncbi:MoaD/ThiS family protein [Methanotorris igneus]|uniref:ThiamineS protein n=1 Tax=Methanotorris igneus (strain DSM 5666 / JCM 11834 / Kol 5) TaxID=880724 RepID=F6BBF7_METIK|nr:MoaD/ThiS family protein [Methanotorris igneus]AEF97164.1 thiamineS protein [Methanotorris igneus Kol 5]
MDMKVHVEFENITKVIEVEKGSKVGDLLKKLNLRNVIVMRNDEFLLDDDELIENDNIKIIKVSSGG